MGYAIQVGAFAVLQRAVRMTARLRTQHLDAYYFVHETGLYKVRFGNYATRGIARQRAEDLADMGLIESFYIVGPEDYPTTWIHENGGRYVRDAIVKTAKNFLGLPYKWGGMSVEKGFDCSGLTMVTYKINGLNLPRSSKAQWDAGNPISHGELRKADLVFFATSGGNRVSHVGIYLGEDRFIHAPGHGKKIRVTSLSNRYFKRRFLGARTYL
jgi:hypothetical protein